MFGIDCNEAMYLFQIMKKYDVDCRLEITREDEEDAFISVVQSPVDIEYSDSSENPNKIIVDIGPTKLSYELGSHSFSRHISNCQITICIVGDGYAAWFISDDIPRKIILEAINYRKHVESETIKSLAVQLFYKLNLSAKEVREILQDINEKLESKKRVESS